MTLLEYIKGMDKAQLAGLARSCDTSAGQIKQVAYGNRRANAALAIALDRVSGGAVPCEETRPDIQWGYLRGTERPNAQRRTGDRRQGERRQAERRA